MTKHVHTSKLKREHSPTLVAFHQTLGVHMLKHAKIRDKEQHEMKIRKRTKDRPRAIHYSHQSKHFDPWVYTPLISQTLQRKQQSKNQISQGKDEWRERKRRSTKFCASKEVQTLKYNSQMIKVEKIHTHDFYL